MSNSPEEMISTNSTVKTSPAPAVVWKEWAKKRAQHAPSVEEVQEISKKVKINITQTILAERQER